MCAKKNALTVDEVMSQKVIFIKDTDTIPLAVNIFERCGISGAPVKNAEGKFVGTLSKTDIASSKLFDMLKGGKNLDEIKVSDIIKADTELIGIQNGTLLIDAAELMLEKNYHRVFIQNEQEDICGVVSSFDLIRVFLRDDVDIDTQEEEKPEPPKKRPESAGYTSYSPGRK